MKKLIDITEEVKLKLSLQAVLRGLSLKKYIELILSNRAEDNEE